MRIKKLYSNGFKRDRRDVSADPGVSGSWHIYTLGSTRHAALLGAHGGKDTGHVLIDPQVVRGTELGMILRGFEKLTDGRVVLQAWLCDFASPRAD